MPPRSRASRPELEASRARIRELAAHVDVDPLTETLNRRGFGRELKRSLAYVKRYGVSAALVYLDLDEFKPVNDRHGHAAGDAVLKAIASALFSAWTPTFPSFTNGSPGYTDIPPRFPRPPRHASLG